MLRRTSNDVQSSEATEASSSERARSLPMEHVLSGVNSAAWQADADIKPQHGRSGNKLLNLLKLAYGTVGVVYGDIGTSPLYVISSTFSKNPSPEDIVGVISLIVWTLTAILLIKYTLIVLHADDHGQGGTFALYSILKRQAEEGRDKASTKITHYTMGPKKPRTWFQSGDDPGFLSMHAVRRQPASPPLSRPTKTSRPPDWRQRFVQKVWLQKGLDIIVVFGVGFLLGDGVLTPAISVVSAVEGLQIAPGVGNSISRMQIVGISLIILFLLFVMQQLGTGKVGVLFSPIVLVWFAFISGIGLFNIVKHDWRILKAFSPAEWFSFFLRNGSKGYAMLGGVVLCITGGEALFADLGHFNMGSIQLSCICVVYPAVIIAYLGQGAYLLNHPEDWSDAFWKSVPGPLFWPLFIFATGATIVASQAMISAAFQLVKQAIAHRFFPRFSVLHKSRQQEGQIYIPVVNYTLMVLCLIVVGTFQTSARMGKAYGIAVLADMLLTSHFVTLVMLTVWKLPFIVPLVYYVIFVAVEGAYWTSTLLKVPEGGWFALLMSVLYAVVMLVWSWGNKRKKAYYESRTIKVEQLLSLDDRFDSGASMTLPQQKVSLLPKDGKQSTRLQRARGIGVYYSDTAIGVPPVLAQLINHFPVLFEVNIFLTNRFVPVPEVMPKERLLVEQLGVKGFYHVIARYGYMERIEQGQGFMKVLLDHVIELLYKAMAQKVDADEKLRKAFNLPSDPLGSPHADDPRLTLAQVPLQAIFQDSAHPLQDSAHPLQDSAHPGQGEQPQPAAAAAEGDQYEDAMEAHWNSRTPMVNGQTSIDIVPLPEQSATPGPNSVELDPQMTLSSDKRALLTGVMRQLLGRSSVPTAAHRMKLVAEEVAQIESALARGSVVYVLGNSRPRLVESRHGFLVSFLKDYLLAHPYELLVRNFGQDAAKSFHLPGNQVLEVVLTYDI